MIFHSYVSLPEGSYQNDFSDGENSHDNEQDGNVTCMIQVTTVLRGMFNY